MPLKRFLITSMVMLGIMMTTLACDMTSLIAPLLLSPNVRTPVPLPPPVIEIPSERINYGIFNATRAEDGAFVLGKEEAPITIVLFTDFWCVHCQNYFPTVMRILNEYVTEGKARLEFRLYPIVGEYARPYAQLAECTVITSGNDALIWNVVQDLFTHGTHRLVTADAISRLAVKYDLMADALTACLPIATQYQTDSQFGREIGISGVPAVRIRLQGADLYDVQVLNSQPSGGVDFDSVSRAIQEANR